MWPVIEMGNSLWRGRETGGGRGEEQFSAREYHNQIDSRWTWRILAKSKFAGEGPWVE